MNEDDKLSIPPEFWLNRELSKVKDPKRRQWLREEVFAGDEGYQKFLKIMEQRKGAHEFETGEWKKKFPTFKVSELNQKKRKCDGGCGTLLPIRPSPWGELCEDIPTICPKCKNKPKENIMSDNNQNDPLAKVQEALNVLAAGKQTLKAALKATLEKAKTELSVLLSPQLGFTFNEIFSDDEFSEIAEVFKIPLGKSKPSAKAKATKKTRKSKSKRKGKKGALKEQILEIVADGNKWSRPEIKKELEKKGIKTSNLYGTSGVGGLVKDEKLKSEGKGRKVTYTIVK